MSADEFPEDGEMFSITERIESVPAWFSQAKDPVTLEEGMVIRFENRGEKTGDKVYVTEDYHTIKFEVATSKGIKMRVIC